MANFIFDFLRKSSRVLSSYVHDTSIKARSGRYVTRQKNDAKAHIKNWKTLSKEQKKEIASFWGFKHPKKTDYYVHEIMLNVKSEFDVRYCPHYVFKLILDDREDLWPWTDKNYYNRFQPALPFPRTFVRNVNGVFMNEDYRLIDTSEARAIAASHLPLIVKPSIDSGEGKNLVKVDSAEELDGIFTTYKKDFLMQEFIVQCDEFNWINPHSVASMRVITAMIDGRAKVLTCHLLCNTTDSVAVNTNTSAGVGVVIVKVQDDGRLADFGYFENAQRIDTLPSGIKFSGIQIPSFREALDIAVDAHNSMPMLDFVGWDITIDSAGKPMFIEWNQRGIETYHSQLTNGPLFGENTEYYARKARGEK